MKKILLSILGLVLFVVLAFTLYLWISDCGVSPFRCGDYPTASDVTTQTIEVGGGPEDMAIDHSLGYPRIIVSCKERRKENEEKGSFYSIDLNTHQSKQLHIEPANFEIFPHGIDIVTIDSITYLYAISHHLEGESWRHPVFRFEIQGDTLVFDESQILENELMSVPNDLDVLSDGSFYATNYVPNTNPNEVTKAVLGIKHGSIVHYDGKGNWQLAEKGLCFPNGIWIDETKDLLFVANGACHEVLRYEINEDGRLQANSKQSTAQQSEKITLGDNLLLDNEGRLWTAAHPCPLDFSAHAEDSNEKSPVQAFIIDPMTLKAAKVFQNNGELISAASTALFINQRLYISQVFDPFVLVVEGINM